MTIYRLTELGEDQPSWNFFTKAERLDLAPGATVAPHFSDGFQMYFFLSGNARTLEEDQEQRVTGGDVLAVRPNVWHGIIHVETQTQVLCLTGPPYPPYRKKQNDSTSAPAVPMGPFVPPKPPGRFGTAMSMDEESTVSIMMLASEVGGDLVLVVNLGALARKQVEEIRRHCISGHFALAALILKMNNDREIVEFPLHTSQCLMAFLLRPACVGIQANLATEAGRERAALMLKHWRRTLEVENIRPCVRMMMREWNEFELTDMFAFLNATPPSHLGVVLQIPGNFRHGHPLLKRYLHSFLPWLVAVESRDGVCIEDAENILEPHGYQGWLIKTL